MCYCLLLVCPGSSFDMVTRFGSTRPRGGVRLQTKLFHPGMSCTVFVLICTVVVLNGFVMCVCVCGFCNVWVS
jgi:hypothetical protein